MSLNILFEDQELLAIEKQAGLFTHPMKEDPTSKENNLLYLARDYCGQFVYPINRLDRPVSGIVLFSKRQELVSSIQSLWHSEQTIKKYTALCRGHISQAGIFESPLSKMDTNGSEKVYQEARTQFWPLKYFAAEKVTLLEVQIFTGRYHQIRRHFRKAVKPLIGDRKHGKGVINNHFRDNFGLDQIFLHCHFLAFAHPTNDQIIKVQCPLPSHLEKILLQLK